MDTGTTGDLASFADAPRWTVEAPSYGAVRIVEAASKAPVCTLRSTPRSTETVLARARLIARCPQLRVACELAQSSLISLARQLEASELAREQSARGQLARAVLRDAARTLTLVRAALVDGGS